MNFVWFPSKNVGININQIEWYSLSGYNQKLTIKMVGTGQRFFIDDEDEIEIFLALVPLMAFEDEAEEE